MKCMNRLLMTRILLIPLLRGLVQYCQVLRASSGAYYSLIA